MIYLDRSYLMKLKLPVSRFPRQFDPALLEIMDRPDADPGLLREDLVNIRKINRWLGAHRLIRSELDLFFLRWRRSDGASNFCAILDLCTGSGDIPRVVVDVCRRREVNVRVTATDVNPLMLDQARRDSADYPEIQFERADALKPPFADARYDLVMCNLALHHFSAEDAARVLKQMWRLTRSAILINDLQRTWTTSLFVRAVIPLFTSNPMTRFDAYLSTRRAFTDHELFRLAFQAEIPSPRIRRYPWGRQAMTAWKI